MDWDTLQNKITKPISFSKKWSIQTQADFCLYLSELLNEGFSLNEAVAFLEVLLEKQKSDIQAITKGLESGRRLDELVGAYGFGDSFVSQLYLAQRSGQFNQSLQSLGNLLVQKRKQIKQLQQVMIYPIILCVFVVIMFVAVRLFLLPQIQMMVTKEQMKEYWFANGVIFVLEHLPIILGVIISIVICGGMMSRYYVKTHSKLKQAQFYTKIPFIKKSIQLYYTLIYSREFAYFLGQGQSLQQMLRQMKEEGCSQLTQEIAYSLEQSLLQGNSFETSLMELQLFRKDLVNIVLSGNLTNRLAVKLFTYSEKCTTELVKSIEQKIQLIQPLVFIGIGFCIVSIYMVLLLPTFTILERGM